MRAILCLLGVVLVGLVGSSAVQGINYTWRNTGTAWTTGSNWSDPNGVTGTVPTTGDTALFLAAATIQQPSVGSNRNIGRLSFDNTNSDYSLAGNSTLTISGLNVGGVNTGVTFAGGGTSTFSVKIALSGSQTWSLGSTTLTDSGTINLGANTLTIDGTSASTLFSGIISGTGGGLVTTNTGTVTLDAANTYTGTTTVSQGVLNIQNKTSLGTTAGGTTVSSGAALEIQGGITVGTEALSLSGTGISSSGALRSISGNNTWQGAITLAASASIQSDAGMLTLSNANAITGTNTDLALKGAGNGTVSGVIALGSGDLNKRNAGTWTLSGANTYTGLTTLYAGVLHIENSAALGTTAGGTTVQDGAALELEGNLTIGAESLSLAGTGISSNGALRNISGTSTWAGAVTLAADTTIQSDAGTLTLSNANAITGTDVNLTLEGAGNGAVSGIISLGTGSLTKNDAGTWTLGGANSYSGGTFLNGGTLSVGNDNNLGSAAVGLSFNGGTLNVNNAAYTTTSRTMSLGASGGTVNNANPFTPTGLISGTGALTKTGAGTLIINRDNTYSGTTTISGGAINIQDPAALGTTAGGTIVDNNAALELQGGITVTGEALSLNGNGVSNGGALRNISGNNTWGSPITLTGNSRIQSDAGLLTLEAANTITGANRNLILGGLGDGVVSGIIATGSGTLVKNDSGTWTLNGANSYTGTTTVNSGLLLVNATHSGGGNYTVNDPGTLGGRGTLALAAAKTVGLTGASASAKASLAPGDPNTNSGIGTFTVGQASTVVPVTFNNFSRLVVDIDGGSSDVLSVYGNVTLSGTSDEVAFNVLSAPTLGKYTIVNAHSSTVSGVFNLETSVPTGYRVGYDPNHVVLVERAKIGVTAVPTFGKVITGASTPIGVTVSNLAHTNGDTLNQFTATGAVTASGSFSGSSLAAQAFATNSSAIVFNSTGLGLGTINGTVNVTTTDTSVLPATTNFSVEVVDHSQASLLSTLETHLVIDLGDSIALNAPTSQSFAIYNLPRVGATAGLDLDEILKAGLGNEQFSTDLALFTNLAAGLNRPFTVSLDTSAPGTYSAVYQFTLSDQDLPGATGGQTLIIELTGTVIPEPAALLTLLLGAVGLLTGRPRK